MLYDDWLDIPCASHSSDLLTPILEGLVTRIPEGIFYNYPYMLNTQGYVDQSVEALPMFVMEVEPEASIGWFRVGVATYSRWSERHLPQIELLAGNPSENLCPVRGGQL